MPMPLHKKHHPGVLSVDTCLYHGNCLDGACAAALVKITLDAARRPCSFVPCWWETLDMTTLEGKSVLFVDITPSATLLGSVLAVARDVFVIDHHESAVDTLHTLLRKDQFLFDLEECGATLTWKWLQQGVATPSAMPPILPYIKALDLFDWREVSAAGDTAAMRMCRCLEVLTEPSVHSLESILSEGQKFLDRIRRDLVVVDPMMELQLTRCVSAAEVQALTRIPHIRVAVVNAQSFVNFLAHRLYSTTSVHMAWVWYHHGPSRRVRVMLRSCGRFDCNAYARAFHGGGHPNSASFVCNDERAMRAHLCDPGTRGFFL